MEELQVTGLPAVIRAADAGVWQVEDGVLRGVAPAGTDLFLDPIGGVRKLDAAMARFAPGAAFQLSARVEVEFAGTFDAGVLVLYRDEETWAKLCFEYSPQGEPMVVSVVTRGESDDCNSVVISGRRVWLRVSSMGRGYAFHYSLDGAQPWKLVRAFSLGAGPLEAGFLVQSPMGQGCRAAFGEIGFTAVELADLRSGV